MSASLLPPLPFGQDMRAVIKIFGKLFSDPGRPTPKKGGWRDIAGPCTHARRRGKNENDMGRDVMRTKKGRGGGYDDEGDAALGGGGGRRFHGSSHPERDEGGEKGRRGSERRREEAHGFEVRSRHLPPLPLLPLKEEESNTCPHTPPPILFLSILEGGGIVRVN